MTERELVLKLIEDLEVIQNRIQANLPSRLRPHFSETQPKRAAIFVGPRGVGKSTYLLNHIQDQKILYVSVDLPMVAKVSLWDLANVAFGKGYEGIVFDEVHFAKNWSQHLKSIYDSFPKKIIWASDSSSIVLRGGLADLSRRFPRIRVPLLSLREYVFLKTGTKLEKVTLFSDNQDDSLANYLNYARSVLDQVNILALFQEYVEGGLRPIFVEGDYEERILNIIEKTIYSDIPFLVPQIQENHLRLLNAIIGYLSSSSIPTLNLESLCREWSIGKEKLYQLLSAMEQIQLIRIIRRCGDKKALTKGAKIFLYDPSFYIALHGDRGNIREALVSALLMEVGRPLCASKDETVCDYVSGHLKLEVGGPSKKPKKSDFVIRDDVDLPTERVIPMWMLGMMY